MRRLVGVSVCAALAGICSAGASASVVGPTAKAAALAATKKHAAHDVVAWNQPGVSYTLGTCRVLHRRPWLAYECGWELHGVDAYCHGELTVAVKRLAPGRYQATGIKSRYLDDHGC